MARDRIPRSGRPARDHAQVSHPTCAPDPHEAAVSEEAASSLDPSAADAAPLDPPARAANGRFAGGHSGNPRGRPRKPKVTSGTVLGCVLDEELPNALPGQSRRLTMREALIRSLCVRGLKDARTALSILKLDGLYRQAPDEAEDNDALLAEDEAALDAFLARAGRGRRRMEEDA